MGELLKYYKECCNTPDWYNTHVKIGKRDSGTMFKVFNTNYRKILSFANGLDKFKAVENKPREEWEVCRRTKQSRYKQYIARISQSKLFSKNKQCYKRTAKGLAFSEMLEKSFTDDEGSFLIICFLLDGYFDSIPNYFVDTAQAVVDGFLSFKFENTINKGYSTEELLRIIERFIVKVRETRYVKDMFREEYIYLDSFYDDPVFLWLLHSAAENDKIELYDYVQEKYMARDASSVLSEKYKNGGNGSRPTAKSNATVLYTLDAVIDYEQHKMKELDFSTFYEDMATSMNKISVEFDPQKALDFIFSHKNVFRAIYNNVEGLLDIDNVRENSVLETDELINLQDFDETDAMQQQRLEIVTARYKRLCKEQNNYKCAGENLSEHHYFTAKADNKNYLEVHHLIPREFGNDFDVSIEEIENYVPLCPHCHRLLHYGLDRERAPLLNLLFTQRGELLKNKDIEIDLKQLKEYYKFDE